MRPGLPCPHLCTARTFSIALLGGSAVVEALIEVRAGAFQLVA
jgi:hypothetical protein